MKLLLAFLCVSISFQSVQSAEDSCEWGSMHKCGNGRCTTKEIDLVNYVGNPGDMCGYAVAISGNGNVGVVACILGGKNHAGIVLVYSLVDENTWKQEAILFASDGKSGDDFGASAAVSENGDTIVVGAPFADKDRGKVYVYERKGNNWTSMSETSLLLSRSNSLEDNIGTSLAISPDGSIIVVGALNHNNSLTYEGIVYVYEKGIHNANWPRVATENAHLKPSDAEANDNFGVSIDISNDGSRIICGSPNHRYGSNRNQGTVYVFDNMKSSKWTNMVESFQIASGDGKPGDNFGSSVALSWDGKKAVVGSPHCDVQSNGEMVEDAGCAYVYQLVAPNVYTDVQWSLSDLFNQTAKLTSFDASYADFFGWSVDISGDGKTIVVSSFDAKIGNNTQQGSAYIFKNENNENILLSQTKIIARDGLSGDYFGLMVAISSDGDGVIVGSPFHFDEKGIAYYYSPYCFSYDNVNDKKH